MGGTRKNIIALQDKKREKGVLGQFGAIVGNFGGFKVKTLCNPGLQGNPSQQTKWYTAHRESSQRSSGGSILRSLRV